MKYAKTKDKFKTVDHDSENNKDNSYFPKNITVNTARHNSKDKLKSPLSPNPVERINSAKFLFDANEQAFIVMFTFNTK